MFPRSRRVRAGPKKTPFREKIRERRVTQVHVEPHKYPNPLPSVAPVKLLLIDGQPIVIAGCRALFAGEAGVEVREAHSIATARDMLGASEPDVIVLDLNLPDGSGLQFTRELAEQNAQRKIVVFAVSTAPAIAAQALANGAAGYVSKMSDTCNLRSAVHAVNRGDRWLPADLVQQVALRRASGRPFETALSEREIGVLRELVHGRSMAEIADTLSVSYKTVANVCAGLREKLDARTTPEMVRIAIELRLA